MQYLIVMLVENEAGHKTTVTSNFTAVEEGPKGGQVTHGSCSESTFTQCQKSRKLMVICPKDFDRTDAPLEPNATWAILGTDIKGKSIVNQEVTIDCSIGCKLPHGRVTVEYCIYDVVHQKVCVLSNGVIVDENPAMRHDQNNL